MISRFEPNWDATWATPPVIRGFIRDNHKRKRSSSQKRFDRLMARKCVLAVDQLRALPPLNNTNDQRSGVYFLWRGPRLIYIGKGNYVGSRLQCHRKRKVFTHATFLEVAMECNRIYEIDYIRAYWPPENRHL